MAVVTSPRSSSPTRASASKRVWNQSASAKRPQPADSMRPSTYATAMAATNMPAMT
jgi:hypothetical protein